MAREVIAPMGRAARRWFRRARQLPQAGSFANNMTFRYLFVLGMLAVLSVASYLVLDAAVDTQVNTATVVKVSGRQRMLSQRTALLAHVLVHNDTGQVVSARQELLDTADLMEESHNALINGDPGIGLPGNPSADVRAMYFDPPMALDSQVVSYIAEARALAADQDAELTGDNPHYQYISTRVGQ